MVIHSSGSYTSGSLLEDQWKHVQEWPEASEEAESDASYETEEEDIYVTLDLGSNVDRSVIASAMDYQLIGLDTPTPYLKVGNHIFRGTPGALVGDELILQDVRDPVNPIRHSHNPIGTTKSLRISFEEVHLIPKNEQSTTDRATTTGDHNSSAVPAQDSTASSSTSIPKPKGKLGRPPKPKLPPDYLDSSEQASTSIMAREDASRVIPSDGKLRDNKGKLYSMKTARKQSGVGRKKKVVERQEDEESGQQEGDHGQREASASRAEQQEDVTMQGTESNTDVEPTTDTTTNPPKRKGRPPGSKTVNRKVPLDTPGLFGDSAAAPAPTRKKRAPPTKKVQPTLFSVVPATGPSRSASEAGPSHPQSPDHGPSAAPSNVEPQPPREMSPLLVDVEAMMQDEKPDEEMLADFLGVDIPEGPLAPAPHLTDRFWLEAEIERMRTGGA